MRVIGGILVLFNVCKLHSSYIRHEIIESLSKRRFCQHGRQPEVNRVVIDGK